MPTFFQMEIFSDRISSAVMELTGLIPSSEISEAILSIFSLEVLDSVASSFFPMRDFKIATCAV